LTVPLNVAAVWPGALAAPVVTVGGTRTVKLVPLVPVPAAVVTLIGPVVAPAGTVAVIDDVEFTVWLALVPLKRTAVTPVKPVPVIATDCPTGPLAGFTVVTQWAGSRCARHTMLSREV
jgi:hypothetical protein